MEQKPYQKFMELGQSKQISFVQEQKQSQPHPLPQMSKKFPDLDFIQLIGQQQKKPIKLATYRFPAQKTNAIVVFFHNICLHIGLCVNFAEELSKNGITFVGFDQRGHGRSEGQKGYLDDYIGIIADMNNFLHKIKSMYPEVPIFLMGHGIGSLLSVIAFKEIKQIKFSGIVMGSPLLAQPKSNKFLATISEVALKLIPNRTGMFATDVLKASRNPTVSEFLKNDPLVYHEKIYANTLMQMVKLRNMNDPNDWNTLETPPLVVLQGQFDKIADPIIGIQFYESIKTKDKEFWWFQKMWNNYMLEEQSKEVANRLIKWVGKHV